MINRLFQIFLFILIFIIIFTIFILLVGYWGAFPVTICERNVCPMDTEIIVNPILLPFSFTFEHWPNVFKRYNLERGVMDIMPRNFISFIFTTVLTLIYLIILTLIVKKILLYFYLKARKQGQYTKTKLFNKNQIADKIFVVSLIFLGSLILINIAIYFISPKTKRHSILDEGWNPVNYSSGDFNDAIPLRTVPNNGD